MLATTLFFSDYCNENDSLSISNIIWDNYVAGLPQHVHIVCFKIWLIRSKRDIIYKDVNEYLNRYSNIRMGIRIIFEYSMVNDIFFSHHNTYVKRKSRKLMTSLFINQMAATRFS